MSKKTEFYKRFKTEFAERSFDPNETMKWLTHDRIITMSWGFQKPKGLSKKSENNGLIFQVSGMLHEGYVLITLAWNDTYTLRFFSDDFEETKEMRTQVYCDELQYKVDTVAETPESKSS